MEKETQKKNRKYGSGVKTEEESWLEQPWGSLIEWRVKLFVSRENERRNEKIYEPAIEWHGNHSGML